MKCPGCASEMVQVEVQTIEIDRCPACGGIVLDKGETEAIESLGLAPVIEGGVADTSAEARATAARCHACNRDMVAHLLCPEVRGRRNPGPARARGHVVGKVVYGPRWPSQATGPLPV